MSEQYFSPGPPFMDENVIFPDQSGIRLIKNDIIQLMKTQFGERVMNPNFGTDLNSSLFEMIDNETEITLKRSIIDAIESWEPRILLIDLIFSQSLDKNTINIVMIGKIKDTIKNFKLDLEFNRGGTNDRI
jgi:phage baseplate assembly protein W